MVCRCLVVGRRCRSGCRSECRSARAKTRAIPRAGRPATIGSAPSRRLSTSAPSGAWCRRMSLPVALSGHHRQNARPAGSWRVWAAVWRMPAPRWSSRVGVLAGGRFPPRVCGVPHERPLPPLLRAPGASGVARGVFGRHPTIRCQGAAAGGAGRGAGLPVTRHSARAQRQAVPAG